MAGDATQGVTATQRVTGAAGAALKLVVVYLHDRLASF